MQKAIILVLLCFSLTDIFSQTSKKVVGYLFGQYDKTLYDRTVPNNPWGMGLGLQSFFNNNSTLKVTADLTADAYLEDDKVLRTNSDSAAIADVGGVINLFAGISYHPEQLFYLSIVTGPSFVSSRILLGLKPSIGFYFSQNHKLTAKISYINIFNRDKTTQQDFGSLSFSIGTKIF
jgi:hypothetical protein